MLQTGPLSLHKSSNDVEYFCFVFVFLFFFFKLLTKKKSFWYFSFVFQSNIFHFRDTIFCSKQVFESNAIGNIISSTFKFQPRSRKDCKMKQLRNDYIVQPLLLFHQWNLLWRKHSISWKSYLADICQNAWCKKWVIPHKTSQTHEMV